MIRILLFFNALLSINLHVSASDISLKDCESHTSYCNDTESIYSTQDIGSVSNTFSCNTSASNNARSSSSNLKEDELWSRDSFHQRCLNLSNEIKDFAMKQLGLEGKRKQINYSDYNITNWPVLVPFRFKYWDEQAVADLRAALPTMIFVKRLGTEYLFSSDRYARDKNRRLILDMFLESFRKQTQKYTSSYIKWSQYHLKGWPRNVKLESSYWNCYEIMTLYRQLDNIKFVPVLPGQARVITYSDGGLEMANNRKRKFRAESDDGQNRDPDSKNVIVESKVHKIDEDNSVDILKAMDSLIQVPETSGTLSLESLTSPDFFIESDDDFLDSISVQNQSSFFLYHKSDEI